MRPSLTPHNAVALLRAYVVTLAEFGKRDAASSVARTHGNNVGFGEFCHHMVNAFFVGKAQARMENVLLVRHPFKIANAIIRRIKINMIDFVLFAWGWADKSKGNKTVHKHPDFAAIPVKLNAPMTVFAIVRNQVFAISDTQYIAKIRHMVKRFVAWNWDKNFMHFQPLIVDSSVGVAWRLTQKSAFGSYPSQAGE
jgi:hypothetical protein